MNTIEERLDRYVGPRRRAHKWYWHEGLGCFFRSHRVAPFWQEHRDALLAAVAAALVLGLMILDAVWQ